MDRWASHLAAGGSVCRNARIARLARCTGLATALVTALATLTAPARGTAQGSSASASMAVTATVVAPIGVTVTQGMVFGRLLAGSSKPASGDARARAEIVGTGGTPIIMSLTMPATLVGGTGTTPLATNGWGYITAATPTLDGAVGVGFAPGTQVDVPLTIPGSGTSRLYVAFGATVVSTPSQAPGDYSGTGQITVMYAAL